MNDIIQQILLQMIQYDAGDAKRIQHFIKVYSFAHTIGLQEKLSVKELFVLDIASILHDIGIHEAEKKYSSCSGKYQEELGPGEAKKILLNFSLSQAIVDRVCFLIAHHHTYNNIDAMDYQILVEADFLVNILRQDEEKGEYLYFRVAEVLQIQNLLENMIYSLVTGKGENNRINQTTMGLIFLYLVDSVQYVEMRVPNQYENMISMTTLDYIEQKYKTATLTELCETLHLPMHVLSKMIKKTTGFNFKELLQRKRLNKSVELMCDTDLAISDIIAAVGYENNSYFHRVFKERYHMTPRVFREKNRQQIQVRL